MRTELHIDEKFIFTCDISPGQSYCFAYPFYSGTVFKIIQNNQVYELKTPHPVCLHDILNINKQDNHIDLWILVSDKFDSPKYFLILEHKPHYYFTKKIEEIIK